MTIFWLRLLWIQAIAVPLFMLYQVGSTPLRNPYRWLNLIVWTLVFATATTVLIRNAWRKRLALRRET